MILIIILKNRLDPDRFLESIRTLLKNNAPSEDFDAFYKLILDENVSTLKSKTVIAISHVKHFILLDCI